MKKILFLILSILSFSSFNALVPKHVQWSVTYKSISATEGEIIISAAIENDWHTYSQKPTEGPLPTSFKFTASENYELVGNTEESAPHEEYDKTFEAKLFVFSNKAEFKQKIKLKKKHVTIDFVIEYMCCNSSMCMLEGPVKLSVKAQ
jgi:DsbC/DsbD-like thiol-disulfide interchange protein